MVGILRKVFGDANEKALKRFHPLVASVNSHAEAVAALSTEQLRVRTEEFRRRFADGESLDDLLPEALAVAREAIARHTGERAFDEQVLGAIALHRGMIAEMATGEGKTLVATLAVYLNVLDGEGVHIITVNDYLASRDAQWYGPALHDIGLTIGVLQHDSAYLYTPEPVTDGGALQHLAPTSSAAGVSSRTSPTARTTSSASTTCATTWCSRWTGASSAAATSPSSTRRTRCSSTRRARR